MILTESHIIKKSNPYFKLIDDYCFASKNLYNSANYQLRANYLVIINDHISYNKLDKLMKMVHNGEEYYSVVNTKVAQMTLRKLSDNWVSFFKSCNEYYKNANKFKGKPKPPKYLNASGRFEIEFNRQASRYKDGFIHFPKALMGFKVKTHVSKESYLCTKICPVNSGCYKVLICYNVEELPLVVSDNYASIDLGVNNLATVTFTNRKPLIVNGKPLKSINQYFNKMFGKIQKYKLNKLYIEQISLKRNNKINDYLHKASHYIVNQLVDNNISTLIVGYNKNWKQGTNMGEIGNQNFVTVPFYKFVNMLKYKCELKGITFAVINESYTSKCSFIDKEEISYHTHYMGNREHRGLFISKNGIKLNADVNGSYNIMKKYLNEVENVNIYDIINSIEACSTPSVYTVNT